MISWHCIGKAVRSLVLAGGNVIRNGLSMRRRFGSRGGFPLVLSLPRSEDLSSFRVGRRDPAGPLSASPPPVAFLFLLSVGGFVGANFLKLLRHLGILESNIPSSSLLDLSEDVLTSSKNHKLD